MDQINKRKCSLALETRIFFSTAEISPAFRGLAAWPL